MTNHHFVIRDQCPACLSKEFRYLYRAPYDKPPIKSYLEDFYPSVNPAEFKVLQKAMYALFECNVCGLVFQREIPDENLMRRLYEVWIGPKGGLDPIDRGREKTPNDKQEIMQIIAYLKQEPSSLSFFDFGMGWGGWARTAKDFGCDSYGSELSKKRIADAQSHGVKIIPVDDIPENCFDFINTEQVFEHLPQPFQTFRSLMRALKPGGVIKISVPKAYDIEVRLKRMDWKAEKGTRFSLNPVAPLEHINFYRRKSIVIMGKMVGVQEVYIPMRLQY